MKVYHSLADFPKLDNAIVTQGTFDGVHAAHQVIIAQLKDLAKTTQSETVLITYDPHPRMVLYPDDHGLKLLSTLEEKIELLRDQCIDHLLILPFTREFSRLSSLQFIRDIIVKSIGTRFLVIGYNHRFGKNREGSFEHLKEYAPAYGFEVKEIAEQDIDEISVSSTRIREALTKGDVKLAARYLGRFYSLTGSVIHGKELGRTIGYPTANISVNDPHKLIPADGIYAVFVWVKNAVSETKKVRYNGMLSIGNNPTVPGKGRSIEVNIFNFNGQIYNQILSIDFVDKLRDEVKFSSLEDLKMQLQKDELNALEMIDRLSIEHK
ncbi:MAG: bifunctional riboflavin kinase/FAD synthetase [Bacteroidia bacterium]|nr:bifunctional riboflavin kinase/FAD synthetase [Bacteroidia bacterium]